MLQNSQKNHFLFGFNLIRAMLCIWFIVCSHSVFAKATTSNAPTFRADLVHGLTALLCDEGNASTAPSQEAFWNQNIFDAQIELKIYQLEGAGLLNTQKTQQKMHQIAVQLARSLNYAGYTAALCPKKNLAFAAAMPSPTPQIVFRQETLWCVSSAVSAMCQKKPGESSLQADFAPSFTSQPISLKFGAVDEKQCFSTASVPPFGVLSLGCRPLWTSHNQMIPLTFIPISNGLIRSYSTGDFPHQELISDKTHVEIQLSKWVNALRADLGLGEVDFNSTNAARLSEDLFRNHSLAHQPTELNAVGAAARAGKLEFLGEDRSLGEDARQLAKQLYLSPRHRRLLLNPRANIGSIANVKRDDGRQFAVITMFEIKKNK